MNKLLGGIGLIIFGISLIIFTIKYPADKPDSTAADYQGWSGGILGIIVGIMMIIDGLKEIY
jgi:hypothetical protein